MIAARPCSKPGCTQPSVATLTFNYHDSMAVLGPLATSPEPHTYDLCEGHAMNLTVPVGWQIVRLQTTYEPAPPSSDDLLALVDAVRAAARSEAAARSTEAHPSEAGRPRPATPGPQERETYATVTQLRPPHAMPAPNHEANSRSAFGVIADGPEQREGEHATSISGDTPSRVGATRRPAPTEDGTHEATPMSAAQFVASELGPFAQPRPALPEEPEATRKEDRE